MTVDNLSVPLLINTTPDELRKIAKEMELKILTIKLGEERTTHRFFSNGYELRITWDQERVTKEEIEIKYGTRKS